MRNCARVSGLRQLGFLSVACCLLQLAAQQPIIADEPEKPAKKTETPSDSPKPADKPAAETKSPASRAALSPREIFARTVRGSGWILIPGDKPGTLRTGSAWIIDKQKKLVVTNHHVIRGATKIEVIFPEWEEGRLVTSTPHYMKNSPRFTAKVFLDDAKRDLAFLKLNSLPAEMEALTMSAETTVPGEMVFSVGNPGVIDESLWVFSSGSVRQVGKRSFTYRSGQKVEAEVIETQSPINPGDSGGPVVNEFGEVIGVVSGFSPEARLVSNFIDLSEVKKLFKEVNELWAPTTAEQYYRRGLQHEVRGDWQAAIVEFNEAIKRQKNYALAMAHRGRCFFEQKDSDTAKADFDEAIKIDPDCIDARLGSLKISQQRRDYDTMLADATQIIRIDQANAEAYAQRARAHYFKAAFDSSLKDIDRAIEAKPTSTHYTMRAEVYLKLKDTNAALRDFGKAIDLDPFNEIAVSEMTTTLIDADRANDAIRLTSELLQRSNNNAYALAARARTMLATKRTADAVKDLTAAIELQPRADLYRLRGKAFMDLDDAERSLTDYRQAIKLSPNTSVEHFDLGNAAFRFALYDEAVTEIDAALKIDPKMAVAYMTRAMANYGRGRGEGIVKADVDRAKELDKAYEKAEVSRRRTRHLIFYNDTDETIELSFYFQAPAVDENIYWYPGEPSQTKPIVWKLDPHTTNRLLFNTKSVDAMQFIYTAKSLNSTAVWVANKDKPISIVPEKEYISWRTEDFTYRLYIANPPKK